MVKRTLTVPTRAGIHARPAALIAETANLFKCSVEIEKEDMRINAKSIMGVITLGAIYETKLLLICDGEDEEEAASVIEAIFENKFERS